MNGETERVSSPYHLDRVVGLEIPVAVSMPAAGGTL